MSEQKQSDAPWIIFIAILSLAFTIATVSAICADQLITKFQGEAVKRGHAEWKPNENSGQPVWAWK